MQIIIEMTAPRSRRPVFKPNQSKPLRSRWNASSMLGQGTPAPALVELMASAPEIPGMVIAIDTQKREGRIFDPLAETPDGKAIWQRMKPVLDANQEVFGSNMQPQRTVVREGMEPDDMKTWLWEMRKLVDSGAATVVSGQLPEKDQIRKLPGKRQAVFADPLVHHISNESKYADSVPVGKAAAATS